MPSKTIDTRGARTVWVRTFGKEKMRATVMLLGASHGDKKPPFVVFKQPPSRVVETQGFNDAHQHGFGRHLWKAIKPLQDRTGM